MVGIVAVIVVLAVVVGVAGDAAAVVVAVAVVGRYWITFSGSNHDVPSIYRTNVRISLRVKGRGKVGGGVGGGGRTKSRGEGREGVWRVAGVRVLFFLKRFLRRWL